MRGASAILPAANKFKTVYPIADSWVATLTPKKQWNSKGEQMTKEKVDAINAFSKPPPIPPVVGPLVVLSLFEAWSSRDNND